MNQKYIQTARLGEGVIYVARDDSEVKNDRRYHAALIIKQHSDTVVDLLVFFADGSQTLHTSVQFDGMADRAGSWAPRVRM